MGMNDNNDPQRFINYYYSSRKIFDPQSGWQKMSEFEIKNSNFENDLTKINAEKVLEKITYLNPHIITYTKRRIKNE